MDVNIIVSRNLVHSSDLQFRNVMMSHHQMGLKYKIDCNFDKILKISEKSDCRIIDK